MAPVRSVTVSARQNEVAAIASTAAAPQAPEAGTTHLLFSPEFWHPAKNRPIDCRISVILRLKPQSARTTSVLAGSPVKVQVAAAAKVLANSSYRPRRLPFSWANHPDTIRPLFPPIPNSQHFFRSR